MALDRMFEMLDQLRQTASVDAAFGEPQEIEGRVFIPVASVHSGLGLGFGQGTDGEQEEGEPPAEGEGGGAGGGAGAKPIAVIEITPEETVIRSIEDETKIAMAGIAMVAWCVFWMSVTLSAIFGKKS